jgi:hypothetical protein
MNNIQYEQYIEQKILDDLLVNLNTLSLTRLIDVYCYTCGKRFPKIRASFIPLEHRKHLITNAIIDEVKKKEDISEMACELMRVYFPKFTYNLICLASQK